MGVDGFRLDAIPYLVGLVMMVASFVMVPVRE